MTDADLIRSLYVDCLAGQLYEEWRSRAAGIYPPWDYDTEKDGQYSEHGIVAVNPGGQPRRERWRAQARRLIDALAAAGLLPIAADYRWVYEPDGTPLGYRERQLVTGWRDAELRCTGCGVTERECGEKRRRHPITAHWADDAGQAAQRAAAGCCPDCRHPYRTPTTEGDRK